MRLTLRTMLAYMHDILKPEEAEEMGRKIEQSEFANGLVHRIRSATRRLRLGAPSLDGKGMGLDPNTVADYLEGSLPPDRVPDFEKVCLESDVHLAEVAACDQILTLILGEAVEVDPELRQRMYQIGSPNVEGAPESPPVAAAPLAGSGPAAASHAGAAAPHGRADAHEPMEAAAEPVSLRPRPQIPDYLLAGRRSQKRRIVLALALAFLGSAVVLRIMGPFNREHPLVKMLGGAGTVASVDKQDDSATDGDEQQKPDEDAAASDTGDQPAGGASQKPAAVAKPSGRKPGKTEPSVPQENPAVTPDPTERPVEEPVEPAGKSATQKKGVQKPTETVEPDEAEGPMAKNGPGTGKTPDGKTPSGESATPQVGILVGTVKATTPPAPPPVLLGRKGQAADWARLAAQAKLASGDQLLSLPAFSPEIVLSRGVQISFAGPSQVQLLPLQANEEIGLGINYCRIFIYTAGVAGARIRLDLAGHKGTATFTDPTSEMALDVRRYLPPGCNPEQAAPEPENAEQDLPQTVIQMFTTIGRIEWQDEASGIAAPIDAGQAQVIIGDRAQTLAVNELPAWARRESSNVDRMGATSLHPFPSDPVALSLKEKFLDRRGEVRCLAARCLTYLESYDDVIADLGDKRQSQNYSTADFDALRDAIARGPESAARVRETLERQCGQDGAKLYWLLKGFSPQQLLTQDADQLVALLDHDSLQIRLFAYENLRRITKKTLHYRAEADKAQRRSMIRSWQELLDKKQIAYAAKPSPLSGGE